MLKNYFKTAFRSLFKNRAFSIINIMGLSIGLCAFLLIYTYVSFERSYDDFHPLPDQLYRVTTDNVVNGKIGARDAMSFFPQGKALMDDFTEVEAYSTSFKWSNTFNVKIGENLFAEDPVVCADENFLKLFNYPIIKGDTQNPLKEPYSLVLTTSIAKKYFGNNDPIGKTVMIYSGIDKPFKVTALVEDVPENTHYKFEMLASANSFKEQTDRDGWGWYNYYTFVRLKRGTNPAYLASKMPAFVKKYIAEETTLTFHFQPVLDIHLFSNFTFEPEVHGNVKTVNFLAMIAFAILIIAWVNYINLSTAKSMDRAKEVGMRKVVGASKRSLITQFMAESFLINSISIFLAITMMQFVFPVFSEVMGNDGLVSFWSINGSVELLIGLFLVSILLSGFYPALVMSSFKPIAILGGKMKTSGRGVVLRKMLVVFQFSASMVLIAGTFVVYIQIDYMKQKDLGMNIDQVMSILDPNLNLSSDEEEDQAMELFKKELKNISGIEMTSSTSTVPDGGNSTISSFSAGIYVVGNITEDRSTNYYFRIDENYLETVGIRILAGRNYDKNIASDASGVILNETLSKKLGFKNPQEAIGQLVQIGRSPDANKSTVIGVINDSNRESLKNKVEPIMIRFNPSGGSGNIVIKMNSTNVAQVIEKVENLWSTRFPTSPFKYQFLDQAFDKAYKEDQKFGTLFAVFSGLAIFIACLGLFGLSSFLAMQKTKEIGIRKVLGASVNGIVILLYKNFFILVITSFVIGMPIIYLIMNSWLENYSYRIDFPWWVLVVSIISLLVISFFTVGFQTLKAALINPAKALKCE